MSGEPKYRDEEWLREQYVGRRQSTVDIADRCGCSSKTISNWLEKHGIKARSSGSSTPDERLADPDWLREQYVKKRQTQSEIADRCGCCQWTVSSWLRKHGIETREGAPPAPDSRLTDPDWLREQYAEKGRSMYDIAEVCDCPPTTVYRWLQRHEVTIRDVRLSGEEHPNWNGGEAPYGPGWDEQKRRQVRDRDGYICQDPHCSVTQQQHIDERGQKLHVHHLRKARDVDEPEKRNAKDNLITLCRDCHRRWEKIADVGLVPQLD